MRVPWVRRRDSNGSSLVPMGYTAVDDGHDNEIRALRYYDPNISEGEFVRVTMTPRLHHVVRMEPTPKKGAPA